MKIDNTELENTLSKKLLGIIIDSKLNFKEHLAGIIKKASPKVNALSRITPYMNLTKRMLLISSFFTSQFIYCHLVWTCHNRTTNNKIYCLHKRCLRIVYNDNKTLFEELLDKDKGIKIHVKIVGALAVEMFKVSNNYSNLLMSEIFDKQNSVYILLNLLEKTYKVSSVVQKTFLFLVLKSGILYLLNRNN